MKAITGFFRSIEHAWRGLLIVFRTERSFRIQLMVALVIGIVAFVFPLDFFERIVLLVAIAAVLVLELVNSMVERLVDLFRPRLSDLVGEVKDVMAGTVLVASLFAILLGVLILWPHVRDAVVRL